MGSGGNWTYFASTAGASPRTLTTPVTGSTAKAYTAGLISNGGTVTQYVITNSVTNYPGVGDGFNRLRGVAPACQWGCGRALDATGSGQSTWINAALDDLTANRVADNIKVMNISIGFNGNPGISTSTRQKVNTAVNNGIVVCCSAGNDGLNTTAAQRQVDDPGRAAMAITVAASNDVNQITDYCSEGFPNPGSTSGIEEDYKPDVAAPGGSADYYTAILSIDSNTADGVQSDGVTLIPDQLANDYACMQGTSMASPFAAGCSALIIDAMQQQGISWDFSSSQHARYVKMVLCATATETNSTRENNKNNPTLQRAAAGPSGFPAGKDLYEGYGMVNPDAAVEAIALTLALNQASNTFSVALGPGAMDRRASARKVNLYAGWAFTPTLTVPSGGDLDLYLYSTTPAAYGTPVILASSTNAGTGVNESISYTPASNMTALVVVKRISGSGTFTLSAPGDATGPSVTIGAPSASLTRSGPITYTVTYADSQSGIASISLAPANITLNATGTANGTVSVSGTGNSRTVTISSITGDGTLGVSIAAGTATDNEGNAALAAGPSTTFTVDNTPPTVSIGAPSASFTQSGPITYTITYGGADSVTLANGNVTLNKTGTANGTVNVTGTGTATRTVTISAIIGDGTLGISIAAGTASDNAGNTAAGAGPSATFTVDNTPPTIALGPPLASFTQSGPITYTVTYSGADSVTLASGNITLNSTGNAVGVVNVSGSGNATRTVTISSITGNGTLGISIAAGTASDNAGNTAPAAGPSATFTVDNTPPTIGIGAPSASLTRSGPVTYTVTYGGADSVTLVNGNITLNMTGSANGVVNVSGSGNATRTVTISSITGDGALGITIVPGTASDNAGNTAPGAGPSATFTADNTPPTVTINQPSGQADPTNAAPIDFQIVFSEAINPLTFTPGDVTITGTAGGTLAAALTTSDNITWNAAITGMTTSGTVIATIAAGVCTDPAGNPNPASTSTDNTVSWAVPSTIIAASTPQPDLTLADWYTTEAQKVSVLKFEVKDQGQDNLPTLIDQITISIGGTAGHAANDIAWAELRDATSRVGLATSITDTQIVFGATPNSDGVAQLTTVPDNTSTEFTVYVYLSTLLLGGQDQTYIFDISETGIGVDSVNSSQMAASTGAITPVTGTLFITQLGITVSPGQWNIGPTPLNSVIVSPAFTLQNTGNVAEDVTIRGDNGTSGWNLQSAPGTNAFEVEADQGADGSYEFVLTTGEQNLAANLGLSATSLSALRYSAPTGDTIGANVPQDFTITLKASHHVP